ncbi:hypothetical protein NDU88_001866 [Pleurodeles waltl]|uniref:Uncharacterized protein n=1 Tax=Pleurodeles waltl TaxID=8319 RepID=A0AAV7TK55_PLEWA|nr:hypothetical protein NDU88_001866 [Pleurodeles waltl]
MHVSVCVCSCVRKHSFTVCRNPFCLDQVVTDHYAVEKNLTICSRLWDIPATNCAKSGTASRFSFENAVPPGRHDNEYPDTSTGNPDIRVPEGIEGEDGLRAGDAERSEDADGGAERRSERPEDPGKRRQNEETQKTNDQGRLEIQGGSEG